jgi:hypothetical protein
LRRVDGYSTCTDAGYSNADNATGNDHPGSDLNTGADTITLPHGNGHCNSFVNSFCTTDRYEHGNPHGDRNSDEHFNAHPIAYADFQPYSLLNFYADPFLDTYTVEYALAQQHVIPDPFSYRNHRLVKTHSHVKVRYTTSPRPESPFKSADLLLQSIEPCALI